MNPRDWDVFEWITAAIVVFMITLLVIYVVDEITEPDEGVVKGKHYTPSHTTLTCTTSNKVTTCHTTYYPECWEIQYRSEGENGDDCVDWTRYEKIEIGDWFHK